MRGPQIVERNAGHLLASGRAEAAGRDAGGQRGGEDRV